MERVPEDREVQPKEIAEPTMFLASDKTSYINGTILLVDGVWEITGYPDLRKFI